MLTVLQNVPCWRGASQEPPTSLMTQSLMVLLCSPNQGNNPNQAELGVASMLRFHSVKCRYLRDSVHLSTHPLLWQHPGTAQLHKQNSSKPYEGTQQYPSPPPTSPYCSGTTQTLSPILLGLGHLWVCSWGNRHHYPLLLQSRIFS